MGAGGRLGATQDVGHLGEGQVDEVAQHHRGTLHGGEFAAQPPHGIRLKPRDGRIRRTMGKAVNLGHRDGRGAASDHPERGVDDAAVHVRFERVALGQLVPAAVQAQEGILDGVAGVLVMAG